MAYRKVFSDLRFFDEYSVLMEIFSFPISKKDLLDAGAVNVGCDFLEFEDERALNNILLAIDKALSYLKNNLTNKPTIYLHKGLNIPLVGHVGFGVIDRGTSAIELKPITGCNLKCVFCSVDQDLRTRDFVIEEEFLISEFEKLLEMKKGKCQVFINAHGEPLFYSPLKRLIKDLKLNAKVEAVILITNASLLSKPKVDELFEFGLDQINVSIHSLDQNKSSMLSGVEGYNIEKILEAITYAKKIGIKVVVAPVVLFNSKRLERLKIPSNESDMFEIAGFCKKHKLLFSPQNYLSYKLGKRISKEKGFDEFYIFLNKIKHIYGAQIFDLGINIYEDKVLKNPFRKGEVVKLKSSFAGFLDSESICVLRDRLISVLGSANKSEFKAKIIRTKDNIIKAIAY